MAQQIADNNAYTDDNAIVSAKVADHIERFWDPRMKQQLANYAGSDHAQLSTVVAAAVKLIQANPIS